MRILSISQNHYVAGGMDRVMFDQIRILSARGHDVVPFTGADPADAPSPWAVHFPEASRTSNTPLTELPATLYRPAAAKSLTALLREEPFDIVHIHSWFKRLSPSILPVLHRSGLPVVQTLHDYRTVCSRSTMYRDGSVCQECAGGRRWPALAHRCNGTVAKTLASLAEMAIAERLGHQRIVRRFLPVSGFQRRLLREMGLPDTRMRTLPNPVRVPDQPAPKPLSPVRAQLLFAGRIEDYKGALLFADLAAMRPEITFAMAGDGSALPAISARGLANLQLLGHLDERALAAAISDAVCVIAPSLCPETFGLSAAEAMAAGRPVIVSRTGGLTEIVRDGIDGIVVEVGDLAGLAAATDQILADREAADAMGSAGRIRVSEEFSEDRFYARLMAIYREVIDGEAAL